MNKKAEQDPIHEAYKDYDFSTAKRSTEIPLLAKLQADHVSKQRITIMLDAAIIEGYKAKAGGRGYQTLINETLRRGLEADSIKEALREVLREERAG
jgi:uncharacterized protein (DUF4415 family)